MSRLWYCRPSFPFSFNISLKSKPAWKQAPLAVGSHLSAYDFDSISLEFNDLKMTGKLNQLAQAIAYYEGWYPASKGGMAPIDGSVSYRNHNPGNLRFSAFQAGQRNGFAYFYNDDIGFMALLYDLWIKASGKSTTGLTADSTIRDLVFKYAPPVENDSEAYLAFILQRTGFSEKARLRDLLLD